jgi:hypothetical protein
MRLRLLVVCAAAVLTLASCAPARGSAPVTDAGPAGIATAQVSPKPLELAETSYRWIPPKAHYPFNSAVDFAYVVRNPNHDFGASEATLVITMRDANGTVIFTDDSSGVDLIRPGETVAGGSQVFPDAKPASVGFELRVAADSWIPAARWTTADYLPLAVNGLGLDRITGEPGPGLAGYPPGYSFFTCVVTNPNATGFNHFRVDVLHRDANGRIVAHYDGFGDELRAGGSVRFRIDTPDKLPAGDTYDAFARPAYSAQDAWPILPGTTR